MVHIPPWDVSSSPLPLKILLCLGVSVVNVSNVFYSKRTDPGKRLGNFPLTPFLPGSYHADSPQASASNRRGLGPDGRGAGAWGRGRGATWM